MDPLAGIAEQVEKLQGLVVSGSEPVNGGDQPGDIEGGPPHLPVHQHAPIIADIDAWW
jgi:hypothetical protein